MAQELGYDTTPPPGTPRRVYFLATTPTTPSEATNLANHIQDLQEVLRGVDGGYSNRPEPSP